MGGTVTLRAITIAIGALLACAGMPAQANDGPGAAPDKAAPKLAPAKTDARNWPPMTFFVAKGEPDACGPGCGEWIAAEGKIDAGTPARLRSLLTRTAKRKLPIYFFSPGGSVLPALEIGRMLRAREMTAGVGRTIPEGCDPLQPSDPACDKRKRSGTELSAQLRTLNASCNSACVYAMIGAKVREVAPDAGLGVHRISITRTTVRTYSSGRVETSRMSLAGDSPGVRAMNGQLARYAAEMGISVALIDVATAVPHEKLRFITRDEIGRFGIDKRDFGESRWTLHELRPGTWSVLKSVMVAKAAEPRQYRTLQLVLLCGRGGMIGMGVARDVDASDVLKSAAMKLGGSEIALVRGKAQLKSSDPTAAPHELWVATAQRSAFEAITSIDLTETPASAATGIPSRQVTLSTLGLGPAVDGLSKRCQ